MASRFFGINRDGYFLLFFVALAFLAFLTGVHPQVLHILLTSFRENPNLFFNKIELSLICVNQIAGKTGVTVTWGALLQSSASLLRRGNASWLRRPDMALWPHIVQH